MRLQRGLGLAAYSLFFTSLAAFGCRPSTDGEKAPPVAADAHDHEHDHDHDHDHDHAEGPHGGHLLELAAEDDSKTYQAEWLHDDEHGVVTVFLLDGTQPVSSATAPQVLTIETRSGKTPKNYELPATPSQEDPNDIAYLIEDPALVTALQVIVEGQEPLLRVVMDGKTFEAKFEKHEHHHH